MGNFMKTWAGECSAWECDGLGHLNMRHYMTKTQQARQMFFIHNGLHGVFKKNALKTLIVKKFHIKYLSEARPDNPLYIETGYLEISEKTATICHMMYHRDGKIAATVVEHLEYIYSETEKATIWPVEFIESVKQFKVVQPEISKLRNIKYKTKSWNPHENEILKLSTKQIGSGVFQPHEIGICGKVTPQALMGRTTETLAHMVDGYPEFKDSSFNDGSNSGALLEAQVFLHKSQVAGDAYRFYSGLLEGNKYTRKLVHHVFNSVTGECIFSMIGAGCLFNLKTRKLIKANDDQVAELQNNIVLGLKV